MIQMGVPPARPPLAHLVDRSQVRQGSRQMPVSMRANALLYNVFNHLGFLSMESDSEADPHPGGHVTVSTL